MSFVAVTTCSCQCTSPYILILKTVFQPLCSARLDQLFRGSWKCRSLSSFIRVILSFCEKRTGKTILRSIFPWYENIFDRWNRELGRHFPPLLTRAFLRRKINTRNLQINTHLYSYIPVFIHLSHFHLGFFQWHATDHRYGLLKFVFASCLTGVRWKLIRICV